MATAAKKGHDVSAVESPDGSVSIGVTIGGAFVPFVTADKARIGQLVENAATLKERAKGATSEEGES